MDILKGKTTPAELARSHDLTVAEVEQWLEDFVSMGTEDLRSHPRDAEARHKAEKRGGPRGQENVFGFCNYGRKTSVRRRNIREPNGVFR
jgi:hypothetical protein